MSRKPADRYESARSLAADVEKYLADEPVSAYREPWTTRLRRWTKKHRTAVSTAAAALVVAAVGLGAIGAVQTRARNDLAVKNGELRDANASLDRQRLRAEDREGQAIAAVKRFRDAVADEPVLLGTPALGDLRRRLLKEPLAFFKALRDRLQADRDTRPESLARLAQASFDLGRLSHAIGDEEDALTAFRESLAIRQKLADAEPSAANLQIVLAQSQGNIGNLLKQIGRPAEAMTAYATAQAIFRKLAEADPSSAALQSDLARGHSNLGILLRFTGKTADALRSHESALAIQQKLADEHPSVLEYRRDLGDSFTNIGGLLTGTGRPGDAVKPFESALAIRRKIADENPSIAAYRADLAGLLTNMAVLWGELGKLDEAIKSNLSALAIQQDLAAANPAIIAYQSNLARTYNNVGVLRGKTDKPDEAIEAWGSALTIRRKLASEHPESPEFASAVGATLNNMASLELGLGRFEDARKRLHEAVQWQRKALAAGPANPTYRRFLANHLRNLARAAQGLGDLEGKAKAEAELAAMGDPNPATAALDVRLMAVIRGGQTPASNAERLQLARTAYTKSLPAAAARLWAEALAADPRLGEDRKDEHRYNAACAAALAGSGKGLDDPKPDDAAKAKLRAQALDWLKAELATWKTLAPGNQEIVARTLAHWKQDTDLAGVRNASALEKLPEPERSQWQALWMDVESLRTQTLTK